MLARHDGQIVFVAGAIPGERVRVRIDRVSKQLAFGSAVDVLVPSPDRRAIDMDWACGGSFYAHIAYDRQLRLKSEVIADAFARIAKLPLAVPVPAKCSQEHGYRMRARLHVRNGVYGFFREGTHDLCDAAATRQLLPGTMEALRRVQTTFAATHITSCELSENADASERAVLLELAPSAPVPQPVDPIEGVSGLLFVDHQHGHLSVAYGSPYVRDRIATSMGPVDLTHHVQSFFQGNRHVLPQLVTRVLAQIPEGTVTDLYAGVGLFAVALAGERRNAIIAVEGDRASARDLESNAAPHSGQRSRAASLGGKLPAAPRRPAHRYPAARSTQDWDLDRGDVGDHWLETEPSGVPFMRSRHSGARRETTVGGRLPSESIEAFDLFPNTAHVETLAVITR